MRSVLNCQRIARDAKEEEYGKSLSEVSRSHSRQRYEKTPAEGPNVEQPNTVTPSVFRTRSVGRWGMKWIRTTGIGKIILFHFKL